MRPLWRSFVHGVADVDRLIPNSGELCLADERSAQSWHLSIYEPVRERRNDLHIWLIRQNGAAV